VPKTIRELADELGVSKQRIQQIIAKLSASKAPNKGSGAKFISRDHLVKISEID